MRVATWYALQAWVASEMGQQTRTEQLQAQHAMILSFAAATPSSKWLQWAWWVVCGLILIVHGVVALTLGQTYYVWAHSKLIWLNIALMVEPCAVVLAFLSTLGVAKCGSGVRITRYQLVVGSLTAIVLVLRGTA